MGVCVGGGRGSEQAAQKSPGLLVIKFWVILIFFFKLLYTF